MKYLVSIDGGGIRGIIPLCALVELEKTTGRPARDIFSFVAGTSTGAIIAAGIAAGIPARRMLELYLAHADDVFGHRWWRAPWNVAKRIVTGALYSSRGLHDLITAELAESPGWGPRMVPQRLAGRPADQRHAGA